jgi:hypothetical protein
MRPFLLFPFVPLLALSACGSDAGQADICERVVRELDGGPSLTVLDRDTSGEDTVAIRYRTGPQADDKRLVCRFAGTGFTDGPLRLVSVRRNDGTHLSYLSMRWLRARLDIR